MLRRTTQTLSAVAASALVSMAGAPPEPLVGQAFAGGFGVGTAVPESPLHIVTGTAKGPGNSVLILEAEGPLGFQMRDRMLGSSLFWQFSNVSVNTRFRISRSGTGGAEFELTDAGNLTIRGDYFAQGGTQLDVPDYVFADDYALMPLSDLEAFVRQHSHLPNVPSAAEIEADGAVNMTNMQMRLLEKIEELTLYTLQQQRTILAQQQMLADLQARLTAIDGGSPCGIASGSGPRD